MMRVRLPFTRVGMTAVIVSAALLLAPLFSHADIERCTGDLNGDSKVNFVDLGIMLDQWFTPCVICSADLDGSGTVNFLDLGLLKENAFALCPSETTLPPDSRCLLTAAGAKPLYVFSLPNGRPWRIKAPPGQISVTGATDLTGYTVAQCWPIVDGRDHL